MSTKNPDNFSDNIFWRKDKCFQKQGLPWESPWNSASDRILKFSWMRSFSSVMWLWKTAHQFCPCTSLFSILIDYFDSTERYAEDINNAWRGPLSQPRKVPTWWISSSQTRENSNRNFSETGVLRNSTSTPVHGTYEILSISINGRCLCLANKL